MWIKRSVLRGIVIFVLINVYWTMSCAAAATNAIETADCLSWRLSVEVNNLRNWWTVPEECQPYVECYMVGGQYEKDLASAIDHIVSYINEELSPVGDGKDAWILDVDDTALSNLEYYKGRKYGGMPFDPVSFNAWAVSGKSVALPATLELYKLLTTRGFKIFFLTGRDESQRKITEQNLVSQGYTAYAGLILRGHSEKGKSAVAFKSQKREELIMEGYRIWGNVGDQWSDIVGSAVGSRTFKLPNPMYFVP
eukprot:Gb_34529 [translate_table: standard]